MSAPHTAFTYYAFRFTCRVICVDGVLRDLPHTGYFTTRDVLRFWLDRWSGHRAPNGGTYEYFETPADARVNAAARPVPRDFAYPLHTCLWHGKSPHLREWITFDLVRRERIVA